MEDPQPFPENQEGLSQAEVERLLAQVAAQEQMVLSSAPDPLPEAKRKDSVQPFDFRHPVFLSARELRKLRLHHEAFIRTLSAKLSIFLRLDFTLQLTKLETLPYHRLVTDLPNPTQLTLFKLEPLRGICLLDFHPKLALSIIDRLMGGPGQPADAQHELSEIELALLDQAAILVLQEWCAYWSDPPPLRPAILGHENNPRFLQATPRDTVLLGLSMEARVGESAELIHLAFPYQTLEPLISKLRHESESAQKEKIPAAPAVANWNRQLDEVKVAVAASWHGLELSARELANLKPGDILQLPAHFLNQIQLHLAGSPKFTGRLGTQNQKWAIEVQPAPAPGN